MKIQGNFLLFAALVVLFLAGTPLGAQQRLSVAEFEGDQDWPLYRPGDVELKPIEQEQLRSLFAFENRNPGDPQAPPSQTQLVMDLLSAQFPAGNPAYLIQWSSLGSDQSAAALDLFFVDRETFQVFFRVGASGPGSFAGRYDIHLYQPEQTVRVRVGDDGKVTSKESDVAQPRFDFASFNFLFARMDLREGQKFRLLNIGRFDNLEPREVSVIAKGRVTVEDAEGIKHSVRKVVMTNEGRSSLVTFWVDDKPPYDYGWRFQLVSNGMTVSQKRFVRSLKLK